MALAAWVSFAADEQDRLSNRVGVERLIGFLMREHHESPFEHSHFTFKIDCPLFVAREFQRHRTQSYNEVSGRYTEFTPRFYVPTADRPAIQKGKPGAYYFEPEPERMQQYIDDLKSKNKWDWLHYQNALETGVAKEVARMGLPLNLMTQFYATVNARNLMHFLELRSSIQALHEIRGLAYDMELHLENAMPLTHKAWRDRLALWEEFKQWKEAQDADRK